MGNNTLYYGDNLYILRCYIKDESVDLIYLDLPFKSNQDHNVLFQEQGGSGEGTFKRAPRARLPDGTRPQRGKSLPAWIRPVDQTSGGVGVNAMETSRARYGSAREILHQLGRLMNVLYYGDNLDILRRYVKDESVDLIYLCPPFDNKENTDYAFACG